MDNDFALDVDDMSDNKVSDWDKPAEHQKSESKKSDNYDDDERKVTGGRNGYGAKLTNIFSKKFVLETADSGTSGPFRGPEETLKRNLVGGASGAGGGRGAPPPRTIHWTLR